MRLMFAVVVGMILTVPSFSKAVAGDAILIEFSSQHCPPCVAMQPVIAELERSGVPVRHVDVAAEPHLASRYGIRQTPTFVVVSGGKEVTRITGMRTAEQLRRALATNPSGPLIATGAKSNAVTDFTVPQTRMTPIGQGEDSKTFASTMAPTAPSVEPMPSMSRADSVERAKAATVRLRVHDGNGFGVGTGTIIDTHGDEALVLTCGHLFRETQGKGKIEVDLFVGGQTRTVLGQVVDYDADKRDTGLVVIRPGFEVQPIALSPPQQRVQNGQTAFSFGCDHGDDPSRRDTRITGVDKFNAHLGENSTLMIAGAPVNGRSGGGLFDDQGRLIGVCNAADFKGDTGYYAGPGSIKMQLDQIGGLAHLYQTPSSIQPPPERIAGLPTAGAPTSGAVLPASAIQPSAIAAPLTSNQEVIVIVRDRNNPDATSRVMTLNQPPADLMQTIERYSR